MNERIIQTRLVDHYYKKNHFVMLPNANVPWGGKCSYEADFLSVTQAGFVYEFEIKCSRADFRADFINKWQKHEQYLRAAAADESPNFFYYVCPENVAAIEDMPKYAGLIYILDRYQYVPGQGYSWFQLVKRAPRIHPHKISPEMCLFLAHKATERFWTLWKKPI